MGQESTEVQMARLEERLKVILERLDEARNDQQASQQNIGLITQTLQSISSRVENVESSLATAKPTIEEFITIKHRVVGVVINLLIEHVINPRRDQQIFVGVVAQTHIHLAVRGRTLGH